MQHVWSIQQSKFARVDDDLRCGSRRLAILQSFIQQKFRGEFEAFAEGCDVSGVNVFSDILPPPSSFANPSTEVVDEERACCSKSIAAPPPHSVSVERFTPNDSSASSSFHPSADSSDIDSPQSDETCRSVESYFNVDSDDSQFDSGYHQIISAGREEVMPFVDGYFVSDVFLIVDTHSPSSLWNPPTPNEEMNSIAPLSVDSVSVDGVVLNETRATSSASHRIPSAEIETTDIESHHSEETGRNSEEPIDTDGVVRKSTLNIPSEERDEFRFHPIPLGKNSNATNGHPLVQETSTVLKTTEDSNSPCEETSKAKVPSPLPSSSGRRSLRILRKKKKKPVEEDWQRELSNLLCPMKIRVSLQRLSDTTEQKTSENADHNENDGNNQVSVTSGGTSVNSRTIEDPLKSCEQTMGGKRKRSESSKTRSTFQCSTCKKSYSTNWNLKLHKRTHNPEIKMFKCLLCPISFRLKNNLQRHQLTHSNEKPFQCSFCQKSFQQKFNLQRHQFTHTSDKQTLRRLRGIRRRSEPSKGRSVVQCPTCKKFYSSKWTLRVHKQIHNPEKKFKCLLCPISFHQKNNLQRHQLIHSNEKPFQCSFCQKSFRRPHHLNDHELIHTNKKPHKCSRCPMTFRKTSTLLKHEKNDNIHPTQRTKPSAVPSRLFVKNIKRLTGSSDLVTQ